MKMVLAIQITRYLTLIKRDTSIVVALKMKFFLGLFFGN